MAKSKGRRDVAKECFWRRTIHRWQKSGLTAAAFCRREKLSADLLGWWRRELCRRDQAGGGSGGKARRLRAGSGFVSLGVLTPPASQPRAEQIEIVLPAGPIVRVGTPVQAELLRQVLAVLEGRG